jgi:hypothetical protein
MSAPDGSFRSPADRGAALGALFILVPIAVIGVAGAAAKGFDGPSLVVLVLVFSGLVWAMVVAARAAAFIEFSPEQVTVGLAPFWRTRLRRRQIADVAIVHIDTYGDYGGWGIKGSARSSKGRLYSVGGETALRVLMRDQRTFLVAFKDPATAERAREALHGRC